MQHFQPILIVIGILAILAVLIHGYILSRKENESVTDYCSEHNDVLSAKTEVNQHDGTFEDVSIIHSDLDEDENEDKICDFSVSLETADDNAEIDFNADLALSAVSENIENRGIDKNNLSVPTIQSEPEINEFVILDDDPLLLDENNESIRDNGREKITSAEFNSEQTEPENSELDQPETEKLQDIFILNVVAKEGKVVSGHELLQFFLTAGFRFGEMSIFHRHLHSDGTGPILFSIANMMAPGVFEPEKMAQFRSQGVSFFLTVPNININLKKAFDMMLTAVEQMAEEFDCVVLNAEREPLTEAQFRDYNERLLHYI